MGVLLDKWRYGLVQKPGVQAIEKNCNTTILENIDSKAILNACLQ